MKLNTSIQNYVLFQIQICDLVLTNNRGQAAAAECVLVKTKTINHQGSYWLITSQAVITTFILYNLSVTSVNHQTPSISVSVFILKCVLFLFLSISGTNRYISKVGSKIFIKKGYYRVFFINCGLVRGSKSL